MLVIGGGAIGVTCALYLARDGARVTLLESGAELGAGCSAGNAGLLCPSHATPLATRASLLQGLRWSLTPDGPFALRPRPALVPWLARFAAACTPARERASTQLLRTLSVASVELHDRLRGEVGASTERTGTLNVYETERGFALGRLEAAEHADAGLRTQVLGAREAEAFEPSLAGPVAGAIFYPDELSGDPLDFVRVVGRAAVDAGAVIRTHTEVLALRTEGGRIAQIETTTGRVVAETVVLAAGAWSPLLTHGLGLDVPVEGGKGYHVDYEPDDGDPRVPIFLQEARVIATRMPGKLRLSGTFELVGLDLSVDQRRVAAIERAGRRRVHGLESRRRLEVWRGLRPCTPDGLPLVGRTGRYENLLLATGHAALGFTLAPITGALVAQLVAGEQPAYDLALLRPDRFHGFVRRRGGHLA
ncbi:MAG: NAD(P)/FAD-dependent oxidoreductase [Gaiellaceae bacterium]